MNEDLELPEISAEEEVVAASDEEKEIVAEGVKKTTSVSRQEIRDAVAEGEMTPSACARKHGISIQYVSKLLKQANIKFGCRKMEREAKEKADKELAERRAKSSFAERRASFAEEHKMGMYQQLRSAMLIESIRQKIWREAASAPAGVSLPSVKEAMTSARTLALIDMRIRILLNLDNEIEEQGLPTIEINYMGDEEIAIIRRGAVNEDELAALENEVVEET
jgi:DNA-binding CsgD family transcriptional regulator